MSTTDSGYTEMPPELLQRISLLEPYASAVVAQQLTDGTVNDLDGLYYTLDQAEQGYYSDGSYGEELDALNLNPQERQQRIVEAAKNHFAQMDAGNQYGRTRFEDRATIGDRAAYEEEGRVMGPDGQPMNGKYGWVIDDDTGYLLFLPEDAVIVHEPNGETKTMTRAEWHADLLNIKRRGATFEKIHHTTPVAGMPATGAGIMELEDGWIVSISDESGHYQPSAENQYEAISALEEGGYSMQRPVSADESPDGVEGYRDATVSLTGADGGGRPTSKSAWLRQMAADNPNFSADELELRWEQFQQTQGNEMQARLKDAAQREMMARFAQQAVSPDELQNSGRYVYDNQRNLYRDEQTFNYLSIRGEVVYYYDSESGNYVDENGEPVS